MEMKTNLLLKKLNKSKTCRMQLEKMMPKRQNNLSIKTQYSKI